MPCISYTLPSINAIFFHTFECFWSVWYFLPHLRFGILFRVCALLCSAHIAWCVIHHVSWSFCLNSHKTCWWDPPWIVCVSQFWCLSFYLSSFLVFPLIFKFDFRCFFSHFHRSSETFANGGYLNDRHLKIIQFKSHFLAEIGNVDTFYLCACCCCCGGSLRSQFSIDSTSSHISKRAQCPENQIVWLSPLEMRVCVRICKRDGIPTRTLNKENNKKRHQKTC